MTKHTYSVRWSEDDGEWVATCDDFPSLSWLDADPVVALGNLVVLVQEVDAERRAAVARVLDNSGYTWLELREFAKTLPLATFPTMDANLAWLAVRDLGEYAS